MRVMHRRRRRSVRARHFNPTYANPVRRRRRKASTVRRSRHHSPAMRAKISRAVKAAMRRRRSGGGASRPAHRRSTAMARRSTYRPARRSHGLYVIQGRKLNPHRRRRHFRRRNPFGLPNLSGLLSQDTVIMAAGAISASVGTGFVLNRFPNLPLANTRFGPIVYQLAIPMGAAYLLRRRYRAFSQGLVLGGVVMAITSVFKSGLLGAQAGSLVQGPMGNFYEVTGMGLAGEIGRRQIQPMRAYIGSRNLSSVPTAVNAPAFKAAW